MWLSLELLCQEENVMATNQKESPENYDGWYFMNQEEVMKMLNGHSSGPNRANRRKKNKTPSGIGKSNRLKDTLGFA